jgi:hypothetical protein
MNQSKPQLMASRRAFLCRFGGGLGGIALAQSLGRHDLLATPAADPVPAAGADGKVLEDAFRATFGKDFDLIGHRVVEEKVAGRHCLIEAAPRNAGFFTVRCDVYYPPERRRDLGEGRRTTWYVMVADRGKPRYHTRAQYGHATTPLACVGDTITFPVRAVPGDLRHRFFREPFDPREAEIMHDSDKGRVDPQRADAGRGAAGGAKVAVESEVEDHLPLRSANVNSVGSHGGDFMSHYLGGVFEARKPGRFNLRASAAGEPFLIPEAAAGLAVEIVPKDVPLRVIADRQHLRSFDGKFQSILVDYLEPGTLVVREGDRVALSLWAHKTSTKRGETQQPVQHPKVTIWRLPFKPKSWPFDHQFVRPEAPAVP